MRCLLVILIGFTTVGGTARADSFDHYTNPILAKALEAKGTQAIKKLTPAQMVENARALPGITAAFVVVKTNEGRLAKLLIQPARQRISDEESAPILLIERYVTFREGEEKTIHAKGRMCVSSTVSASIWTSAKWCRRSWAAISVWSWTRAKPS